MKGKTPRTAEIPFDAALKKLEAIVQQLEAGDVPLEESIRLFEEGVELALACGRKLDAAERKVEMLVRDEEGALRGVPFPPEEGGE